jgi:hypothetical protein
MAKENVSPTGLPLDHARMKEAEAAERPNKHHEPANLNKHGEPHHDHTQPPQYPYPAPSKYNDETPEGLSRADAQKFDRLTHAQGNNPQSTAPKR